MAPGWQQSSDGTHLDHGGDPGASGNESDALLDVWRVGILGDGALELQSLSDLERVDMGTHLSGGVNLRGGSIGGSQLLISAQR